MPFPESSNDASQRPESVSGRGREAAGEPPLEIGGYRLVREITQGGQATIFQAIQLSTGRKVALKLIYGGSLSSDGDRRRIEQEAHILASLDHPNIVSVIDKGETSDGSIYFVMPYVKGKTLDNAIDEGMAQRRIPVTAAELPAQLKLFIRICDAVNAAHLKGIVHRDLKPMNIIIDEYGEPHILDFGLAHTALNRMGGATTVLNGTESGQFMGSLKWASPEQVESAASTIDIRSDVYSLGLILYEMLTGHFPYNVGGPLLEIVEHIARTKPVRASRINDKPGQPPAASVIDDELDDILLKALAKNRTDRYQSAGELSRALTAWLEARPGLARSTPAPPARTRLVALSLALLSVAVLAAGVFMTRTHSSHPTPQPSPPDPHPPRPTRAPRRPSATASTAQMSSLNSMRRIPN